MGIPVKILTLSGLRELTSQSMARADLQSSSLPGPPPALAPVCLPDVRDEADVSPRVRMDTRHLTRLTGNTPGAPNIRSFLKSGLERPHYHHCHFYHVTVIITLVT